MNRTFWEARNLYTCYALTKSALSWTFHFCRVSVCYLYVFRFDLCGACEFIFILNTLHTNSSVWWIFSVLVSYRSFFVGVFCWTWNSRAKKKIDGDEECTKGFKRTLLLVDALFTCWRTIHKHIHNITESIHFDAKANGNNTKNKIWINVKQEKSKRN